MLSDVGLRLCFASGECLAQRRLPTRAELLGDFGIRHEEVEPVEGTTHDQEFGCDSGVDEPARVLHVFFDEQVESTDTAGEVSEREACSASASVAAGASPKARPKPALRIAKSRRVS
jgi:hypothetical protein